MKVYRKGFCKVTDYAGNPTDVIEEVMSSAQLLRYEPTELYLIPLTKLYRTTDATDPDDMVRVDIFSQKSGKRRSTITMKLEEVLDEFEMALRKRDMEENDE